MKRACFCSALVSWVLVISMVGCSTSSSDVTTTTTPTTTSTTTTTPTTTSTTTTTYLVSYFPNTDGYKWTYNYLYAGLTGTEIHAFNGTTSYSGLTLQNLKAEMFIASSSATFETLTRLTSSDAQTYGTVTSPTTETETAYVFPLVVGNSWTHHAGVIASVVSQETVTVPAGTFADCYRVKVVDGTTTSESWLANNVGVIKIQNQYAGVLVTCELTAKNF